MLHGATPPRHMSHTPGHMLCLVSLCPFSLPLPSLAPSFILSPFPFLLVKLSPSMTFPLSLSPFLLWNRKSMPDLRRSGSKFHLSKNYYYWMWMLVWGATLLRKRERESVSIKINDREPQTSALKLQGKIRPAIHFCLTSLAPGVRGQV